MGSLIESIHSVRPSGRPHSSIELAARAARGALEKAAVSPQEIGLLVNVGVYRDENVCEPSNAAFIQRAIGANPGFGDAASPSTFSFDLNNGAAGLLSALHLADGFLRSGRIEHALLVASDVDPTPQVSAGLDFDPVGAAVVLGRGGAGEGFSGFSAQSFASHIDLFDSRAEWIGGRRELPPGVSPTANVIDRSPGYAGACARCAAQVVRERLKELSAEGEEIDLIVPADGVPGLEALSEYLEEYADRIAPAGADRERPWTAGPATALERVLGDERHAAARRLLWVAVGAGITVATARYVRRERGA